MNKLRIKTKNISVVFIYIALFFVTSGSHFFSIPFGGFQITISRFFFWSAVLWLFIYKCRFKEGLRIFEIGNKNIVIFMFFWVDYALITIFWVQDLNAFIHNLYFLLFGVVATILMIDLCVGRSTRGLMISYTLGLAFQSIVAWYEIIFRDYRFIEEHNRAFFVNSEKHIPVAMLGNPNNFATVMYLAAIFTLILGKTAQNKRNSLFWYFLFIDFCFMIYQSDSRAGMIGIVIAVVIIVWLKLKRTGKAITLAAGAIISPFAIYEMLKRYDFSFYTTKGESFEVRVNLIKNGLLFLVETLGFGVGNGQLELWMLEKSEYYTRNVGNMHNYWAEILSTYGIVVFSIFIFVYMAMIYKYYRCSKWYQGNVKNIAIIMIACLIGFVVVAVSSSSNFTQDYIWAWWAIIFTMQGHIYEDMNERISMVDFDRIGRML